MGFAEILATADVAARDILGGDVTYTPGVGDAVEVTGIFDAAYVRVDLGQPGVATVGPAVFLRLSELPSDPLTDEDATVTVAGSTYAIHEPQPDGLGGVVLQLHKTS